MDLSKIVPKMLDVTPPKGVLIKPKSYTQPSKPSLEGLPISNEEIDKTFQTLNDTYQKESQSFNEEDLEFDKFPQIDNDYQNNELKMMSSEENSDKKSNEINEKSQIKEPETIKDFYKSYFINGYFLDKNSKQISPGDIILLYDNMTSILKRNISYSKYVMRKNEELEEKVRVMEQRNRMLSRELQNISEKWKKEGKMDISR